MHFKRFLDIKGTDTNHYIVFKDNKIIYEPELNTFILDSNYLNIDLENSTYVGIAEDCHKIYAIDINSSIDEINIGYKSLVEYDTRHLLAISSPEDIVLMGRANPVSYTHLTLPTKA